ncbi:MAG: hypothetical protein CXZ00_10465 [Acidobacteria bacterium]|nr:MAG: hypothetical protein CXZ00_10465 [Acidobacteriota bacterium]
MTEQIAIEAADGGHEVTGVHRFRIQTSNLATHDRFVTCHLRKQRAQPQLSHCKLVVFSNFFKKRALNTSFGVFSVLL